MWPQIADSQIDQIEIAQIAQISDIQISAELRASEVRLRPNLRNDLLQLTLGAYDLFSDRFFLDFELVSAPTTFMART